MLRKRDVDIFLETNLEIKKTIKDISSKYRLSDFIKVTPNVARDLQTTKAKYDDGFLEIEEQPYACENVEVFLYDTRKNSLYDTHGVSSRLAYAYSEYLYEILLQNNINKVFYIVAYHFLTTAKQLGYDLTAIENRYAPFLMNKNNELRSLGKSNFDLYTIFTNKFSSCSPCICEEDLTFFNNIYVNCGDSHHATKHFSLLECVETFPKIIGKYCFENEFTKTLNSFIFKYKIVCTDIPYGEMCRNGSITYIINNLVDVNVK